MQEIVQKVYDAQKSVSVIPRFSETYEPFDVEQAYAYQAELVEQFVSEGREIIGYKMGLTSREKMKQMGVTSPVYGILFEDMLVKNSRVDHSRLIHPKAEPEVAVKFKKDVPMNASIEEIRDCIGYIAPAIDIIDSRYEGFKFNMTDVIVDNCSAAQFAVGEWVPYEPEKINIDTIFVGLLIDKECVAQGISSAVLGSPLTVISELVRLLAARNIQIKEDQIVLTGAITAAEMFARGSEVMAKTMQIGDASFK